MTDLRIPLSTDDHVVVGNRLRDCRNALMHALTSAAPGPRSSQEDDFAAWVLDWT